jgi:hypothetical protein
VSVDLSGLTAARAAALRGRLGPTAPVRRQRKQSAHPRPAMIGGVVTSATRRLVLRANAVFLVVASMGALLMDIAGIFFARGPQSRVLHRVPNGLPFEGVGFIEAHGLALIFGITLWRVTPSRSWHLTAAGIHLLLGTANLVFWQGFASADMLMVGYVTTSMHWLFVVLQLLAAATSAEGASS